MRQRTGQCARRDGEPRAADPRSRGALQHVAGAALGVEQPRLAAGLELAPQVRDEDVDRVGRRDRVVAPDVLEQALAGDDQPLVAHQVLEQLELAVGELDLALAALHLARVRVELSRSPTTSEAAAARRPAPQQRADPREQLLALERLRQVVVGAGVEAADAVLGLGASGQHQDRHVALRAQAAADLDAVEAGQAEVEHDEVRDEAGGDVERLDAVGRGAHLVALVAQRAAQDVGDLLVVLDDEDAAAAGRRSRLSIGSIVSRLRAIPPLLA